LLIVLYGPVLTFALNTITFIGIIYILFRWQREPTVATLPTERFLHAMRAGLRYARSSPPLQYVLIRAVAFFLFSSVVWALLPLVSKVQLNQDAGGFGLLVGAIGLGAIIGATQLPKIRRQFSSDQLVMAASIMMASAAFGLAMISSLVIACMIMLFVGFAWITALSSLNVAAQNSAPDWVRARVLSIYLVAFFGSMALGSGIWGWCAKTLSINDALIIAAFFQIVAVFITLPFKLKKGEGIDLAPSGHWPTPIQNTETDADQGPVLITIEYDIEPKKRLLFNSHMQSLENMRKRDGAFFWSIFTDVANPNKVLETFMVESWLEHLRQHDRVTQADKELQDKIRELTLEMKLPKVSHYVADINVADNSLK